MFLTAAWGERTRLGRANGRRGRTAVGPRLVGPLGVATAPGQRTLGTGWFRLVVS
jgi:hypothetical protein